MSDKELLELAAKAAGYTYNYYNTNFGEYLSIKELDGNRWNPLDDDGDAFRLAVELSLCIMPLPIYESHKHSVEVSCKPLRNPNFFVSEEYGSDKSKATRLAIARLAAEIGRKMK